MRENGVSVVVIFIGIGNTESRSDLEEFVGLALLTLSILLTHGMRKVPSFLSSELGVNK